MGLSTFDQISAITRHSAGFADAARGNLDASVEHCPGWSVADLVHHLTEVHWFWGTIVAELLDAPPEQSTRPPRVRDDDLVPTFVTGAARLVEVLREADQSAACWTWARWQQDVAFVTRHQVQEAAVHHWDAEHAAGRRLGIEEEVAADAVDEFLHFSVASEDDPDEPVKPPLAGTLALHAVTAAGALAAADALHVGRAWTLEDGSRPGTVRVVTGLRPGVPVLEASASDLLLWLYARVELDTGDVPADLIGRFRGMGSTD
jgi:uncharacterized protein (TIGR03083 family)